MSKFALRSVGGVVLGLLAATAAAAHDVAPRMIRVEVRNGSASAYHRGTGDLIATVHQIRDYKTRGNIVVFRDTADMTDAFNAQGMRLVSLRDTADYQVGPRIVVLRDRSGFAVAVNDQNQELARWRRTKDYRLTENLVVMRDVNDQAVAVNADNEVLVRWSNTADYQASRNIVVLRDHTGRAVAKSKTNRLLADWRLTTDYQVKRHIVIVRDSSKRALAMTDDGKTLANWRDVEKYHTTNRHAVLLDLAGTLLVASGDGPIRRRDVAEFTFADEDLTIQYKDGRTEQMILWDEDDRSPESISPTQSVSWNEAARAEFLRQGGDRLGAAALRTNDLDTATFRRLFGDSLPQ